MGVTKMIPFIETWNNIKHENGGGKCFDSSPFCSAAFINETATDNGINKFTIPKYNE